MPARQIGYLAFLLITLAAAFPQAAQAQSCSTVHGMALLHDPQNQSRFSPQAIADYAIEHFLADTYGLETKQTWLRLETELVGRPDITVAEVQELAPDLTTEIAENLEDLARMHRAIVILEGADLRPEVLSRLLSRNWEDDWRAQYLSRDEYIAEFERIADEIIAEGLPPSLATTLAHMHLLNRLDLQHTGRDRTEFNNPDSWDDVALNDMQLRSYMMRETIGELPEWITARLNQFGFNRSNLLGCLFAEQDSWIELPSSNLIGIKVLGINDEYGAWCRPDAEIRIEILETADFKRIDEIAAEAVATAVHQCGTARNIKMSAWTDQGAADVYQSVASAESEWTIQEATDQAHMKELVALVAAAEAGDARAMVALAQRYEHGVDLSANQAVAHAWMRAAAESGDSLAAAELARMYSYGIGTRRDLEAASDWAHRSAEAGNPVGLFWRAMIDWPFNSAERFLESYTSGSLILDMIWQPTVDLELAAAACDQLPFSEDSLYDGPCDVIAETKGRMDEVNQRWADSPPPTIDSYSDTVGDFMFDMRDPVQMMGASMMNDIR